MSNPDKPSYFLVKINAADCMQSRIRSVTQVVQCGKCQQMWNTLADPYQGQGQSQSEAGVKYRVSLTVTNSLAMFYWQQ